MRRNDVQQRFWRSSIKTLLFLCPAIRQPVATDSELSLLSSEELSIKSQSDYNLLSRGTYSWRCWLIWIIPSFNSPLDIQLFPPGLFLQMKRKRSKRDLETYLNREIKLSCVSIKQCRVMKGQITLHPKPHTRSQFTSFQPLKRTINFLSSRGRRPFSITQTPERFRLTLWQWSRSYKLFSCTIFTAPVSP